LGHHLCGGQTDLFARMSQVFHTEMISQHGHTQTEVKILQNSKT